METQKPTECMKLEISLLVDFTIGYQFKKFNVQGRLGNIFDVGRLQRTRKLLCKSYYS